MMNIDTETTIRPADICNLGRLPMPLPEKSPLRQTVKQILENKDISYKDTFIHDYYKERKFNPETLSDFYEVDCKQLSKYKSNNIFLPWIHTHPVEKFVNNDFYGLRGNSEIIKVVNKLKKITLSIERNGYSPQKFLDRKDGFMTGYWLEDKGCRKFFIISGNHRSAVLGAIKHREKILVHYEKCGFCKPRDIVNSKLFKKNCLKFFLKQKNNIYINIINISNVSKWPSVQNGFLREEIAAKIFNRYIGEGV